MSFFSRSIASGLLVLGAGYVSGTFHGPWKDPAAGLMVGIVFLGVSYLTVADEVIGAIRGPRQK
ncbi:MAG: hypothetical protein IT406_01160 [Candidatus Yanofskybacteria bacterium]|nr:hypothetical protein [Candidatus Yanofskybacteria bacterium]